MKKNGKRLVLSVGAVLTALCITAGATMAYFNDTEPLAGDFVSGKLDISVTPDQAEPGEQKIDFENLRPLTEEAFEAELTEVNGKVVNANTEGYSPIPVYFQPVTVRNEGTLPAQIMFQMVDDGPDGKKDVDEITVENVTINDKVYGEKVTQTGEKVTCEESNYILKDKLKIFVYEKNGDGEWEKVPNVNLNENTLEEGETAEYQPFTSEDPLPAGKESEEQFLIAGYLPEDAGNAYQAKHYHGVLLVYANQVEEEAEPDKLPAPTIGGEPYKAFFSDYYIIQFNEDNDVLDPWMEAVERVTVNGEEFEKTDYITLYGYKTYGVRSADKQFCIGNASFEVGETYHVVVEAEGYETLTFDIVAE